MELIIISIITAGSLGFIFGGGLAYAAKIFHVEKDPRIDQVAELLPGANCGACGYAGCQAYAEEIINRDAPINACTPGGSAVIKKIAALLGKEETETIAKIAYLKCKGSCEIAKNKGIYNGIEDCKAAALVANGNKICEYGCLGYGNCVTACPFNAITMDPSGLPIINESACTGCGKCVTVCPRNVLALMPKSAKVYLACSTQDRGKTVKDYCSNGCIGCSLCEKKCPYNAIIMVNNLPVIDFDKCQNCGVCVSICPNKSFNDRIKNRSKFFIDTKCIGCTKCAKVCPVKAITGNVKEKHNIDSQKCIGCGLCVKECPVNAIRVFGALGYSDKEEIE